MKKRKKISERQKKVTARKNFFPTLLVTVLLWLSLAAILLYVEPYTDIAIILFFGNLYLVLLFSLSLIFTNTRRGVVFSTSITFFLLLRYFGIGNIINLLLILGIVAAIEVFFSKNNY